MTTRTFTFITPELDENLTLPLVRELGYKETITNTESFSNAIKIPEWATNIKNYTKEYWSVLHSYDVVTETPTTETVEEFIQQYFKTVFLREKIMPAIVKIQTATLEAEKLTKEEEIKEATKIIEETLIANS